MVNLRTGSKSDPRTDFEARTFPKKELLQSISRDDFLTNHGQISIQNIFGTISKENLGRNEWKYDYCCVVNIYTQGIQNLFSKIKKWHNRSI